MMALKRILILGKDGQLGYEINQIFQKDSSYEVLAVNRETVDLTNESSIAHCINQFKPHIIFNATAYTAVDKAQTEPELAYAVNSDALVLLANAANSLSLEKNNQTFGNEKNGNVEKPWIIHFSTDYVFDGKSDTPYKESHKTSPLGVYGLSKFKGEENLMTHYENAIIFRTSWVYSYRSANFVQTMRRLGAERETLNVVDDQYGCPNYAPDLAASMTHVVDKIKKQLAIRGVYHLTSSQATTWYDFAKEIMKQSQLNCEVKPIPSSQFPTPAERPKYSVMSANKIKQDFDIVLPSWHDALVRCLKKSNQQTT